jgi:hypothetical protein
MKYLLVIAFTLVVCGLFATSLLAAPNPGGTGQPSQTCVDTTTAALEPGQAAAAPGSAFNETRPGTAGTVYAGNGATESAPANDAAVSQYDVACFQVTQNSH